MGLCQSLQRRRKDQTMWQPKVLVEFHLKFKYCIILLKWSIQNIETTLWRQGVHYLHCYISCACVCVSEPVNHSPLLPKKRSLWSIWVLHGVHSATLMVSLFVLIAKLIIIHFYDRNKIIGKLANSPPEMDKAFFLSCRVWQMKNLTG